MSSKCFYVPRRYVMIVMAHFGFFIVYALRVNLSVVLVAMVNSTYVHSTSSGGGGGGNSTNSGFSDPECKTQKNETAEYVSF